MQVVFLSAFHDYRTGKRASIHQVARAMVELGHSVSFISSRFSLLSRWKGDSRLDLWRKANTIEKVDGIDCYLWRTLFHPFSSNNLLADKIMAGLYRLYAMWPNRSFDAIVRSADYLIIESSVAAILVPRIHRLNKRCRVIYYATDRLDTVGAHPFIYQNLIRNAPLIHHVCLRSPKMAPDFAWASGKLFRVGFGIDERDFREIGPNPYSGPLNAVSVGSMLFDPTFFQIVAPRFPNIKFHVIGCGKTFEAASNVIMYPEMPFRETLPFIKYADMGLAPYRQAPGVEYLADSSLKLSQYEYMQIPAVCPTFAAGQNLSRSGYIPGDEQSMCAAVAAALSKSGRVPARAFQTWLEIAARVLEPEKYPDARVQHCEPNRSAGFKRPL